jgi:hypothetical protein
MNNPPGFDEMVSSLRALLDAEYRRGQADAAQRIINAARVEVIPAAESTVSRLNEGQLFSTTRLVRRAPIPSGTGRHRAPVGAPDALVKRVLLMQGPEGAGSQQIQDLAETEEEKQISLSGIRFALDRGKASGRYRNERGKWFLTEEVEN